MKRLFLTLVTLAMTISIGAMTESRVRTETLFLTDKMAYELRLNNSQYNDVYEINYDFINAVGDYLDDASYGESWALNDYYEALDVRNDDLRWVLSSSQYRRFLNMEYFARPFYQMSSGNWGLRVYLNYTDPSFFYYRRPYCYTSYFGGHYRGGWNDVSYYRNRYSNVAHYRSPFRMNGDGYRYNSFAGRDFRGNNGSYRYGNNGNKGYNNGNRGYNNDNRGYNTGNRYGNNSMNRENNSNRGYNNDNRGYNTGNRYGNNSMNRDNNSERGYNTNNGNRNYNSQNNSGSIFRSTGGRTNNTINNPSSTRTSGFGTPNSSTRGGFNRGSVNSNNGSSVRTPYNSSSSRVSSPSSPQNNRNNNNGGNNSGDNRHNSRR